MASSTIVTLDKIIFATEELSTLVRDTYGPDGQGVMICTKSPRSITLTRNGLDILKVCKNSPDNPIISEIILKSIQSHVNRFGDGSKKIILGLNLLLRQVNRTWNGTSKTDISPQEVIWRMKLCKELLEIRTNILPKMSESLKKISKKVSDLDDVEKIFRVFLSTRFQPLIAKELSGLLTKFVETEIGREGKHFNWQRIASRFKSKTIEVIGSPVQKSCLEKGLFVTNSTRIQNYYSKDDRKTQSRNFIIHKPGKKTFLKNSEISIESGIHSKEKLPQFMSFKLQQLESFLHRSKSGFDVSLFLTSGTIPSFYHHLFYKYSIAKIENVPKEELLDLSQEADVMIFESDIEDLSSDLISKKHIGKSTEEISEHLIGKTFFMRICCSSDFPIFHPVICGMTQAMVRQYSSAMEACLKLVATSCEGQDQQPEHILGSIYYHPIVISERKCLSGKLYFDDFAASWMQQYKEETCTNNEAMECLSTVLMHLGSFVDTNNEDVNLIYPVDSSVNQIEEILRITENLLRIDRIFQKEPKNSLILSS